MADTCRITIPVQKPRNDQVRGLFHRTGHAGAAVAVDTRPKSYSITKTKRPKMRLAREIQKALGEADEHPSLL